VNRATEAPAAVASRHALSWSAIASLQALGPGLLLALVIAMAAYFISAQYGGSLMLYALLFGAAFNYLANHERIAPGVAFAATAVLRFGVALLGARITLSEVGVLGWQTAGLVAASVALTLVAGWRIGRYFGLTDDHAVLSASAVAICGASATLAIASVLPARDPQRTNTLLTIVGATTLSTIAMVLYPLIARILSLDELVPAVTASLGGVSSWCILMAVAALGVTTPLQRMIAVGPRPIGAMVVQSAFLAVFVLAWEILRGLGN